MSKHVHHWQQIEKNAPKIYDTSREALVDFITTPYIVTRKLLCTRCAELKTIVEPDPIHTLFNVINPLRTKGNSKS